MAIKDDSLAVGRIKVDADLIGVWAVHRSVSRGRTLARRWSVSHAPSGSTPAADLRSKREALDLAQRLVDLPPGDAKGIPVETRLGVLREIRGLRSQAA